MIRGYVPLLAIIAAIWGASYLFIKVAVDEVEPTAMMFFRLVLATAVLAPVLFWRSGGREAVAAVRGTGWKAFAIGFLNAAFPFVLIAWGEKYVDSGVAAIANATVPIFVVLLALRFNPSERVSGRPPVGDPRRPGRRRRAGRPPPRGWLVGRRGNACNRRRLVLVCLREPLRPAQLRRDARRS